MPAEPIWPPLPERYDRALREAVAYVRDRFAPAAIIAAGTILRGAPDPASDIDLVVVHHEPWRQRLQRFFGDPGVPVEIFVNPPAAIEHAFASEQARARPVMAHMIATGTVVFTADGAAAVVGALRDRAASLLAGPLPPLGAEQLTVMRYAAATLYEDAVDVAERDPAAAALLLARAVAGILDYWFRARGERLPRSKDLFAALASRDPSLAELAREAAGPGAASITQRLDAGRRLAEQTIGATGFFEWESERQVIAPSPDAV